MALVSLLADQLSGQFLILFGSQKENGPIHLRDQTIFFVHSFDFFVVVKRLESDRFSKKTGQNIQESGQKKLSGLRDGTIFFWLTKKKIN